MIPYVEQPCIQLGPLRLCAFGFIVAASIFAGLELGRRRFKRLGFDAAVGEGLAWYAIICGFLGAHLFSVIFYFPRELIANPILLFKVWEDISSFGGMLGGFLGILLFFHRKLPSADARTRLAYFDVAAFVFPVSLMIGRIACSLAHDHPGTITRFPLAISLSSAGAQAYITRMYENAGRIAEVPAAAVLSTMGFHDLGWYEFLYLAAVVAPLTLWWGRTPRRPGFFLGAFALLYAPVRFALDFLRVSDARYAGLTPAQFTALAILLAAVLQLRRWSGRPGTDLPMGEPGIPRDASVVQETTNREPDA